MKNVKLISGALGAAAAGAFGLALMFGLFFYTFYLKWVTLFENHRYFDPQSGIVYHDSSSVHGTLAALFLFISISCLLIRWKLTKGKIR